MPRRNKDFAGYKKCEFKRQGADVKSLSEIIKHSVELHFVKTQMALLITVMGILYEIKLLMWAGTLMTVYGLATARVRPRSEIAKRWMLLALALTALHYSYQNTGGSLADELMMLFQSIFEFLFY